MSKKREDYYKALGLPRTATDKEIDAAYRSLAVKYHPDTSRNASHGANEFKHVTEAHEVLSDPERRRRYDQETQVSQWQTPSARPHTFDVDLPITPEEARYGATVPVKFKNRFPCPRCFNKRNREAILCSECEGKGFVLRCLSFALALPAGIRDGSRFLYREADAAGAAHSIQVRVCIRASW